MRWLRRGVDCCFGGGGPGTDERGHVLLLQRLVAWIDRVIISVIAYFHRALTE